MVAEAQEMVVKTVESTLSSDTKQFSSPSDRLKHSLLALAGPELYQALRNRVWRMRQLYSRIAFRKHTVIRDYSGIPLSVLIEDQEAANWYSHDWPALDELTLLSKGKLNDEAIVFEIGAHQGVVAMILAKRAKHIVAVEPNNYCAAMARRNIALNHIDNVDILHAAAGATSGHLTFAGTDHVSRGEGGEASTSVAAVTIDELGARFGNPNVLYIDAEGYEVEILRGAVNVLATCPDLFVEVHVDCGLQSFGGSLELLDQFVSGYTLHVAAPYRPFVKVPRGEQLSTWPGAKQIVSSRFFLVALS